MTNVHNRVIADLKQLGEWSKNIIDKLPPTGSMISDELYLQNNAIQIAIISQLEYFLKIKGKIKRQFEILDIIKNSPLQQLEKDNLIYLFLIRHTLVHNGGHYNKKFIDDCGKHTALKMENVSEGLLSSLHPKNLPLYIDLVEKLIGENSN